MSKTISNLSKDLKDLVNHFDLVDYDGSADSVDEIFNEGLRQVQGQIDQIKNDLERTENDKYKTTNRMCTFECDKDGYMDNICIKGKTMVNLCYGFVDDPEPTTHNNYRRFKNYITGYDTYTVMVPNIKPGAENTYIGFEVYDENNLTTNYSFAVVSPEPKVVNIPSNYKIATIYGPNAHYTHDEILNICQTSFIIPGNHIDDMPTVYFTGLSSIGLKKDIEILNYKGDNLFNGEYDNGYFNGSVGGFITNLATDTPTKTTKWIECEPNTIYYIIGGDRRCVQIKNNNTIISFFDFYTENYYLGRPLDFVSCFKTPEECTHFRVYYEHNAVYNSNPLIITKDFVDRKTLPITLHSLPDGTCDTIEKHRDKYYLIKRCGIFNIFNGGNGYYTGSVKANTIDHCVLIPDIKKGAPGSNNMYCSSLKVQPTPSSVAAYSNLDFEYICYDNDKNQVVVSLSKSKVGSSDITAFTNYVSQNQIMITYELETPKVIELTDFNLPVCEGVNTLVLNADPVPVNCDFEVTNSRGSELAVLKNKVNNINDDIKQFNLGFRNGWYNKTNIITKCVNDVVHINFIAGGGVYENKTVVAVIPREYAPRQGCSFLMYTYQGHCHSMYIYDTGHILIDSDTVTANANDWFSFNITYVR